MTKLLKVQQVAELFEVTPATVRIWLTTGVLQGIKIGKGYYWRIPESEVDRLATHRHGEIND